MGVWASFCLSVSPLTLTQSPRGNDPQRDHEHEQHRARADGHQRLEDKPSVEVDSVQRSDTPRRCICEELWGGMKTEEKDGKKMGR